MKNVTLFLFALSLMTSNLFGQDNREKFFDLINKNDTTEALKLIKEWKKKSPNEPEIYVLYFNYYGKKSMQEVIRLDGKPKEGQEALAIQDNDTSKKEPVGYIYGDVLYNPEILNIGFAYIDTGITKFPNRLDMRFGKIYMLGQIEDYGNFTKEIIKTIEYSETIKNKWLWTNDKPVKDPQKFMLLSIQNYIIQIYNVGKEQLGNMRKIAETVLKFYPDNVENLSNLSITYIEEKEYDKALVQLLKAEKVAPQDYIVLNNIANCYYEKNDKVNAKKYYELVIEYGNDDAKEFAKQRLKELKKK